MSNRAPVDRRAFLIGGSLFLMAANSPSEVLNKDINRPDQSTRIGLVTDLHFADKPPAGTRHYRESTDKLAEAAREFANHELDFLVELGDLIDSADTVERELQHLTTINKQFSKICPSRHYVIGNHCVHTLTKDEFLSAIERERSYYSFDQGGIHYVILDSCFLADGTSYGRKNFHWTSPNIPDEELKWLEKDLAATDNKTIVFAHQRLDVSNDHGVDNARSARKILEKQGNVVAVFQGHSHANDYKEINGIHYCTLVAMVEGSGKRNSGFSVLTVKSNGNIQVDGFIRQSNYRWTSE